MVGLFVHPDNAPAIARYVRYGFENIDQTYRDPESGVIYQGMITKIPEF